jgi:carbon-monoxide dehydrogenase large subunit
VDGNADGAIDSPWIGRPLLRREDGALVRGDGTFVDNMMPAGALHLVFVRSPFAHALIRGIDATAARSMPGVVDVATADDLEGVAGPMPIMVIGDAVVARSAAVPMLAHGVVRFAGEPVAAVLAESRATGEDGAELVQVDYEPLEALTDPEQSRSSGVVLHEGVAENVLLEWRLSGGDVAGQFAGAARVVSGRFRIPRLAAAPIEPRGCVAALDLDGDVLTLWCSAQDPHRPLAHLSAVLGRAPDRIRIVVPDVGGAFGSKGSLAPEYAVAAALALRSKRAVKWVEDRRENFLAAYQGRGLEAEMDLAIDPEGRFLAVRAHLVADLGAYLYPASPSVVMNTAQLLTGAYDIPAAEVDVIGVATNKAPVGPYRGAGRPEAAYLIERMADLAAAELRLDPVEIRRRNLVPADRFPYRTPLGHTYDSGDYLGAIEQACVLLDYHGRRDEQRLARAEGRLVGIGLALFVERAGPAAWESAAASVGPDGHVVIRMGSSPNGQGHETTFSQIAADALGLAPEDVEIIHGDSAEVPPGVGTFGSRSVTIGGSAVLAVLEEIKARARVLAAHLLEVAEVDLRWEAGGFVVAGAPERRVGLGEVAAAAGGPAGPEIRLEATGTFTLPGPVFPFGAYAAVVEVERETGVIHLLRLVAVDDAGTIVNPLLAEGQVQGSSVQGLAAALSEEVVYDDDGQLLTGSFMAYGILSPADVTVRIQSEFRCTPSPFNPLGAKGVGESGTIAVPAALANAVADALAPLGISEVHPPFTPEKLWSTLRQAGKQASRPKF